MTERFGHGWIRRSVMKKVLIATAAAMAFIAAPPAFASPSEEAAADYPGWLAAQKAAQQE
jgi:hypothetical protein